MMNVTTKTPRCLCCGTAFRISVDCVCPVCARDAGNLRPMSPNHDFVHRVKRAKAGRPQVCMTCGWGPGSSCTCETPDRETRYGSNFVPS